VKERCRHTNRFRRSNGRPRGCVARVQVNQPRTGNKRRIINDSQGEGARATGHKRKRTTCPHFWIVIISGDSESGGRGGHYRSTNRWTATKTWAASNTQPLLVPCGIRFQRKKGRYEGKRGRTSWGVSPRVQATLWRPSVGAPSQHGGRHAVSILIDIPLGPL